LLRDLFDLHHVGTILSAVAAEQAAAINQSQDLSDIRVGPHDEIYQGQPVLVGVDARSTIAICKKRLNPETKTPGISFAGGDGARLNPRRLPMPKG